MKLLLALCLTALLMDPALSWWCPANQTNVPCKPCETYCCDPPQACNTACIPGDWCKCNPGYVRESRWSSRCILRRDCPAHAVPLPEYY